MPYTIVRDQMLRQRLRVVSVNNHGMKLDVLPDTSCAKTVCCSALLIGRKPFTLAFAHLNPHMRKSYQVGEVLELAISARYCFFAAILLYGLPLVLLLVAVGTISLAGYSEVWAACCGLMGLLLGLVLGRYIANSTVFKKNFWLLLRVST